MAKPGEWINIDQLEIPSGKLSVSDTSFFFQDFLVIDVPPGMYNVGAFQTQKGDFALLRVAKGTAGKRGRKMGAVVVDFAQVGVCDRLLTETALRARGDDRMHEYFDALRPDRSGVIDLGDVHVAFARSGLGDGRYEVWELLDEKGERVGAEIDFDL